MSGYNRIKKYVSGQVAIRQAFGNIGYADFMQTGKPDLMAWIADSQDLISPLKTYQYIPCAEYVVCDNRIEIPNEMQIILCATHNGAPMTMLNTPGCGKIWENSPNRGHGRCACSAQGFYVDECYMHFKPFLPNGTIINVDGMQRPLDDEGFPMVAESAMLAVSEYICAKLCLRFRDNRYQEFQNLWLRHCKRARAEANQMSNQDIANLGFMWYKQPYPASSAAGWAGWGYTGGVVR